MAPLETAELAERRAATYASFGSLGSIVGLLVLVWAAALASAPLNDNSFFTHLATGRLILDDGRVPSQDPYTFSALGEPWTVQSWLASVAYAGFEELGGTAGLRLLVVLVFGAAAWTVWRVSRPASSLLVRVGLVSAALFPASGLWTERPYMIGIIGLGLVWLALEDEIPWFVLIPVLWIWGNTHGSFLYAVGLVALVLVGGALDRGRAHRWDIPVHERRVAFAVLAGTAAVALGPLGLRALTFPLVAARRGEVFRNVTEWQPPSFRSASELAYLAFASAGLLVLARWGREWRLLLPGVTFVVASFFAQRNIVMACVMLVATTAGVIPVVGSLRGDERPRFGSVLALVVVVLLLLTSAATLLTPASSVDDYAARPLSWLEVSPSSPADRLATDVLNGNLLEVLDGRDAAVFVDDRFDMLPDDVFQDYLQLEFTGPRWEKVLEARQIERVLWRRSAGLGSLLAASASWRVVYSDASWVVAERR